MDQQKSFLKKWAGLPPTDHVELSAFFAQLDTVRRCEYGPLCPYQIGSCETTIIQRCVNKKLLKQRVCPQDYLLDHNPYAAVNKHMAELIGKTVLNHPGAEILPKKLGVNSIFLRIPSRFIHAIDKARPHGIVIPLASIVPMTTPTPAELEAAQEFIKEFRNGRVEYQKYFEETQAALALERQKAASMPQ